MSLHHLKPLDGQSDGDLVTVIIRAIELAKSCGSETTVYLLKMALLDEGIRLAADLREAPAAQKNHSMRLLNLVGRDRIPGYEPPARRAVSRPRR